jgi:hypothetical protein
MLLAGDDTNPIIHVEELRPHIWWRPRSVPGAAHVYLNRSDRLYLAAGGLTMGEMWWRAPCRYYVVDLLKHDIECPYEAVSGVSGASVMLSVSACWRVVDPVTVVATGLVDVTTVVHPRLRLAVDTAMAGVPWETARGLARALQHDLLADPPPSDGLELSDVTASVLGLQDSEPRSRGPDV